MGRSVSIHPNAVATVFLHLEDLDPELDSWASFVEDLRDNVIFPKWPSFQEESYWPSREVHVIAANDAAEISVSEYCGCVAICLAPRDIAKGFAKRIAASFYRHITKCFKSCALQPLGTMLNGETAYRRIQ